MTIIADSGSTKTTWSLIEKTGKTQTCITSGINPFFLDKAGILHVLETEFTLPSEANVSVFFYGAGCIPSKTEVLSEVLKMYFSTEKVSVNTDLLAAARALCGQSPGIACILGTGSNSCYYDGESIVKNVSPLGYILGDEGSGAVLGKKLLADILKNQAPGELAEDFYNTYSITAAEVLENVYRKPLPNRFLAQYTKFLAKHLDHPYIVLLIEDAFGEFIRRNLFQYEDCRQSPVHFTGSIAYYFKEQLREVLVKSGLVPGRITKDPMEGLIAYHLNTK